MSCSTCCCGSKSTAKKMSKKEKAPLTPPQPPPSIPLTNIENNEAIIAKNNGANSSTNISKKKSRSISWECLPFTSKKTKHQQNAAAGKKSKNKNQEQAKTEAAIPPVNKPTEKPDNNSTKKEKEIPVSKSNQNQEPQSGAKENTMSKSISGPLAQPPQLPQSQQPQQQVANVKVQQPSQHQPYSASLVNSGFGFGFDLHGGEMDNQLTFIVNVQSNGDAARKGLKDGDILVSIQGKNVIGIRRVAIERILKQYKVDQEIEIVVCRLKDPTFILNLTTRLANAAHNHQLLINGSSKQSPKHHHQKQHHQSLVNTLIQKQHSQLGIDQAEIARYLNLNEQIFNELINFQDPSYSPVAAAATATKTTTRPKAPSSPPPTSSSSSSSSSQKQPMKRTVVHHQETTTTTTAVRSMSSSNVITGSSHRISAAPVDPGMDENLISIELNPSLAHRPIITKSSGTSSTTSSGSASPPPHQQPIQTPIQLGKPTQGDHQSQQQQHGIQLRPPGSHANSRRAMQHLSKQQQLQQLIATGATNTNSAQYSSDSGYTDSSRKSNKSSYYSDISIVVYDNLTPGDSNLTGSNDYIRVNNKPNDVLVVSVTQQGQQPGQFQHPQMQPMHLDHFNSQYVPKHMLPLTFTTASGANIAPKSVSVNDFTGSILAADRNSYYNRQQQQQQQQQQKAQYHHPDKRSSSTCVDPASMYNVSGSLMQGGAARNKPGLQSNEAYIYLTQQPPGTGITGIPSSVLDGVAPGKSGSRLEQSFETFRDAIINRKRSSSEQINQSSPPPPPPELMFDKVEGSPGQNVVYIKKQPYIDNGTNRMSHPPSGPNKLLGQKISIIEDSTTTYHHQQVTRKERTLTTTTTTTASGSQQPSRLSTSSSSGVTTMGGKSSSHDQSLSTSSKTIVPVIVGSSALKQNSSDNLLLSSSSPSSGSSSASSLTGATAAANLSTSHSGSFKPKQQQQQSTIDYGEKSSGEQNLEIPISIHFETTGLSKPSAKHRYKTDKQLTPITSVASFEQSASFELKQQQLKKPSSSTTKSLSSASSSSSSASSSSLNPTGSPTNAASAKCELTPPVEIDSAEAIEPTSIDIEIYNNPIVGEESSSGVETAPSPSVIQRVQVIESQQQQQGVYVPFPTQSYVAAYGAPPTPPPHQQASSITIMPRASRRTTQQGGKQQKPYQIACTDPSILSVKPVKMSHLDDIQLPPNEVSLTVPVTSSSGPNSIIDEDTPESESSQKSTRMLTLKLDNYDDSEESSAHATTAGVATSLSMTTSSGTPQAASSTLQSSTLTSAGSATAPLPLSQPAQSVDSNLRLSNLSIKYIDDNSVSAPLSPEQHHIQQQPLVDELKPYEPSDTDADSNLASTSAPSAPRIKSNICLIDVNKEPQEAVATPVTMPPSISNASLDSGSGGQRRKKRHHHHHHHRHSAKEHPSSSSGTGEEPATTMKRSVTDENLVGDDQKETPSINVSLNFGSTEKTTATTTTPPTVHRKSSSRKERRHRHTIPIAIAAETTAAPVDKENEKPKRKSGSNSNINRPDVRESYLAMSTSTSSCEEEKPGSTPRTAAKITLNQKASKSNSFSSRRDSLKKQQLAQQQQQQQEQEQPKPVVTQLISEPDIDVILKAVSSTLAAAAEVIEQPVEATSIVSPNTAQAAQDSEAELRRRKVLEWDIHQAIEATVPGVEAADKIELGKSRDTADEEDELKKLQGKEAADQAIFSDSGANQYDRRSTPGIEIDKSTAYDFMSSMQESNDEEQNMLKSKSTAPVVAATVEEVLPAEPSLASSMIVPDLEANTIIKRSIDDSEYSGAKSDNEAFIISKQEKAAAAAAESLPTSVTLESAQEQQQQQQPSAPTITPIKSLRKKHDSTDTLDSISSYEIRFERPHYPSLKPKMPAGVPGRPAPPPPQQQPSAPPAPSSPSKSSEETDESSSTTTSSPAHQHQENEAKEPVPQVTNVLETSLNVEDTTTTSSGLFSSSTLNDSNQATSTIQASIPASSADYSSNDVSPRDKNRNQNESFENEPLDLLNSSALTTKSVEMNDQSSSSSSSSNNTTNLMDPLIIMSSTLNESSEAAASSPTSAAKEEPKPSDSVSSTTPKATTPTKSTALSAMIAAMAPAVLDDGYGSTGSLKNATTNDSLSSIEDSSDLSSHASSNLSSSLVSSKVRPMEKLEDEESTTTEQSIKPDTADSTQVVNEVVDAIEAERRSLQTKSVDLSEEKLEISAAVPVIEMITDETKLVAEVVDDKRLGEEIDQILASHKIGPEEELSSAVSEEKPLTEEEPTKTTDESVTIKPEVNSVEPIDETTTITQLDESEPQTSPIDESEPKSTALISEPEKVESEDQVSAPEPVEISPQIVEVEEPIVVQEEQTKEQVVLEDSIHKETVLEETVKVEESTTTPEEDIKVEENTTEPETVPVENIEPEVAPQIEDIKETEDKIKLDETPVEQVVDYPSDISEPKQENIVENVEPIPQQEVEALPVESVAQESPVVEEKKLEETNDEQVVPQVVEEVTTPKEEESKHEEPIVEEELNKVVEKEEQIEEQIPQQQQPQQLQINIEDTEVKTSEVKEEPSIVSPKQEEVRSISPLTTSPPASPSKYSPKISRSIIEKNIRDDNDDLLIPPVYDTPKAPSTTATAAKMSREVKHSDSQGIIEPDITPIDLATPVADAPIAKQEVDTTTTTTTTTTQVKKEAQPAAKTVTSASSTLVQQRSNRAESGGSDRNVPVTTVVPLQTAGSSYSSSSASSSPYKSNISPRHTVITRRNIIDRQPINHNWTVSSNAIQMRPTSVPVAGTSAAGLQLRETRQKEKQQLCELNDRFASYVERVRFLEAQNKKLQMELSALKGKWGHETKQIEQMYQIELDEARNVLNETSKLKDSLQLKLDKSEQDLDQIRKKYSEIESLIGRDKDKIQTLQDQIAANDAEIGLLRRRLGDLQDEEKRLKLETTRMMGEIQRVSSELEFETKQRLMLENDKQSLEEQLLFLKEIHAKEIEELKHLSLHESGIDPTAFFKNELASAIKDIREEYETLNQTQRNDLERWYRLRVSEIQRKNAKPITDNDAAQMLDREQAKKLKLQVNESKRFIYDLKAKNAELDSRIRDLEDEIKREENESAHLISTKETEIRQLKDELSKIVVEYDDLMASKTDLEVEIRTYRRLLEGEENRDGLRQIVEGIENRHRAITTSTTPLGHSDVGSRVVSSSSAHKINRTESPRRFGHFLSSSKSHDEDIDKKAGSNEKGKKGKQVNDTSPLRRSILEANETEADSSAAEDLSDDKHAKSTKAATKPTHPPITDFGEIQVAVNFDTNRNKLIVRVIQAQGLINTDKDSLSDPYARIILVPDKKKRTKRKTKIIKDSLHPNWDETFEFEVASLAEARTKSLDVVVKNDKSLFSREKTFMGECLISLESMFDLELGNVNWYRLQDQSLFESVLKKLQD